MAAQPGVAQAREKKEVSRQTPPKESKGKVNPRDQTGAGVPDFTCWFTVVGIPLISHGMGWLQGIRPKGLLEWSLAEKRQRRRKEGCQQGQEQRQERWRHRISCLLLPSAVLLISIYAVCGLEADQRGGGSLFGRTWFADFGGGSQGSGDWTSDRDSGRIDEDPTWGRPRQRAEPPKGCIAISGIEWLGRAFENGILGRNPGDCPFWSLFGSSSRTTLAAWSFSESVSSGFPSGYPGAWNYGVGPFVGLSPMPFCFSDAIKSDGSLDGVFGARFERATDYFSSFVDWLRAACYQTAVHQNPHFGAFSYAVGRMTSFSWIAGAASLALCCGWLMIKSLLIFHKKIYLSPLRGLRDEKLLIQWYLNLLATTMAFIYQWVWTANWLLGTEFLLDGVHIRPRAATMQGGMFLAVFLGLLLLARFCITFRIDSLKGCRKVGMTRLKPIRHHRSDSKRMSLFLLFNILGAQATQGHQAFPWGVEQPSSSTGDHTATPDPHDVWSGTTWRDHGEGTCNGETPTAEHFSLNALTFTQLNHEMNNYHHVSSFSTDWMRRDDNSGCPREAKLRRSFCILPSYYHTADLPESRLRDAVVGRFWASPGTNPSLSCGGGAAAVAQEDIFSKHRHMQSRLADTCALGSFGRDFSTMSESDVLPDNEHEGEVEPIMQLFSLMQSSVEIVRVIEGGKLAD